MLTYFGVREPVRENKYEYYEELSISVCYFAVSKSTKRVGTWSLVEFTNHNVIHNHMFHLNSIVYLL